jgi:hypothetical protein
MKPDYFGIWLWMPQKREKWRSVPFCLLRSNFLRENHGASGLQHGQRVNLRYTCSIYITSHNHHPPRWVTILFWNDYPGWHMEYKTVVKGHLVGLGVGARVVLKMLKKECALCPLLWTGSREHTSNTKVRVIVCGVLVILFPQSFQ